MCSTPAALKDFPRAVASECWTALASDPLARVSSIDVLDEGELTQLDDHSGNRAALTASQRSSASVPELFAENVARTPDAVARHFRRPVADLPRAG